MVRAVAWRRLLKPPILLSLSWILAIAMISGSATNATVVPSTATQNSSRPAPAPHALPATLAQWQPTDQADYFAAIEPTPAGYLVWSQFPVRIYIQPPDQSSAGTGQPDSDRAQAWYEAVQQAMQAWTPYLPLTQVDDLEAADITILRSAPPIQRLNSAQTSNQPSDQSGHPPITALPRIRAAETRYDILLKRSAEGAMLWHRFTIQLSPSQTANYTQASARHEIGHALGLWGHSPSPTDTLYFSQVRQSPVISVRDVNTLKKVYQQPTLLGWWFTEHQ